jgi:hypothetical protein
MRCLIGGHATALKQLGQKSPSLQALIAALESENARQVESVPGRVHWAQQLIKYSWQISAEMSCLAHTISCSGSLVAFNRDAVPWGQHFDLPEPTTGCLTIMFLDDEDLILFSAVHDDQLLLRDGLCRQMVANGQPLPIFEGFVRDIPKISYSTLCHML